MQISYLTYMEGPQNFPVWGALPLPAIHQVSSLSNFNFPCYSDLKKVNRNFNAHTHIHTHPHTRHTYIWRTSKCPGNLYRRHKNNSHKWKQGWSNLNGEPLTDLHNVESGWIQETSQTNCTYKIMWTAWRTTVAKDVDHRAWLNDETCWLLVKQLISTCILKYVMNGTPQEHFQS